MTNWQCLKACYYRNGWANTCVASLAWTQPLMSSPQGITRAFISLWMKWKLRAFSRMREEVSNDVGVVARVPALHEMRQLLATDDQWSGTRGPPAQLLSASSTSQLDNQSCHMLLTSATKLIITVISFCLLDVRGPGLCEMKRRWRGSDYLTRKCGVWSLLLFHIHTMSFLLHKHTCCYINKLVLLYIQTAPHVYHIVCPSPHL